MHSLIPAGVSWRLRCPSLLAVALLTTACAHSPPTPTPPLPDTRAVVVDPEPFLAPAAVTLEKPAVTHPKPNVCADPARYPPRAFDLPQLSASQLMALFDSPSTARELLGNIKLLAERDFLVQSAFFDEQVLLKFFGAAQITWEASGRPTVASTPYPQLAFGPMRVAHVSALRGELSNVTVRVVSSQTCMGWRQTLFPPRAWWSPVTYNSGYMQINVSSLDDLNVGIAKEVFGADPDEAPAFFIAEFGGGVSGPGHLIYKNIEKERRSAPFSSHQIEFVPQQNGNERPTHPGGRRMFSDQARLIWVNITQAERDM